MLAGCTPTALSIQAAQEFDPRAIKTVAVAPFEVLSTPQVVSSVAGLTDEATQISAPEIIRTFEGEETPVPTRPLQQMRPIPSHAGEILAEMVSARLRLRPGIQVIPPKQTAQVLIPKASTDEGRDLQTRAQQLGRALSVDAVLTGLVRVYRERQGGPFGGTPAAVGFEVRLIRTSDGLTLWRGDFYEEQKPLTEDFLGFLRRGGRFVTVEELAHSGVVQVMRHLPLGQASPLAQLPATSIPLQVTWDITPLKRCPANTLTGRCP
ncbi:MAG: hypothetical protein D6704_03380 [Nitrospirae bacterium]|nr:MAG: hypothetical protein D6704_03380 [Nitrospirota bacterium]